MVVKRVLSEIEHCSGKKPHRNQPSKDKQGTFDIAGSRFGKPCKMIRQKCLSSRNCRIKHGTPPLSGIYIIV